jgi:hypothetical protein
MNERIRELVAQAGFDPAALERMGVMPQAEKFAQLIVRDVLATVKRTQYTSPDFEWAMLNNYDLELEE